MPVKDVQKWGLFRTKLDVLDRGEEAGGGTEIYTFLRTS